MKKLIIIPIACILTLSACSSDRVSHFPSYKLTIPQGNQLDQENLQYLQTGMTKQQVRSLLGTPLLVDPFHTDRWDYPYLVTKNGKQIGENKSISLFFENDILTKIDHHQIANQEQESPEPEQAKQEILDKSEQK